VSDETGTGGDGVETGRHEAGIGNDGAGTGDDDLPDEVEVPEWDDEYLDRVAHRLKFNYDLSRDERVAGERFPLYGRLLIESRKQFFHPSLDYANQRTEEHLFADRVDRVRVADLERYAALGEDLADTWIEADEEHRGTEFTFVLVVPTIPDDVRSFVEGFRDRTLLRFGYYGHYEVNIAVVAPDEEAHAASANTDVWRAFAPWADDETAESTGLLGRLFGRFRG
jgi:hypothetical protein